MDELIKDSIDKHDLVNERILQYRRQEGLYGDMNNSGEYTYETRFYFLFILCLFVLTYMIRRRDNYVEI